MSLAEDERQALADLLLEVGPDAPTMCEGWTTRDLAAHLVTRQSRPDAMAGIVIPPLARWTDHVRDDTARDAYPDLVRRVRAGAPRWNPMAIGSVDEALNALEYLVHHEDVRRAQPSWTPRDLAPAAVAEIWKRGVRAARLGLRHAPVGVALAPPAAQAVLVHKGSPVVTVRGEPLEVVLWSYGRTTVANVKLEGDPGAVEALDAWSP